MSSQLQLPCNNYIFSRSVNNNRSTVTLAANQLNYNYNCTNLASAGTFICHLRQGGYVFTWRLSVRLSVCIFCLPQMYLCTTKIPLNRGSRPCLDSSVPLLIVCRCKRPHPHAAEFCHGRAIYGDCHCLSLYQNSLVNSR